MKRGRIVLVIVLIVLAGGGYWLWRSFSGSESTDDAQVDGHVYAVNARVGGTVIAVNVHENQQVKAGEILLQIDDRDFRNTLAKAAADLGVAQAGYQEARSELPVTTTGTEGRTAHLEAALAQAKTGVESAQKDYEVAQSRYNVAVARSREVQTTLEKTGRDLERLKGLIAKDEISQQQFDAAVSANDAAKAAAESAKAAMAEAQSNMTSAQSRVTQARSAVAVAETDLNSSKSAPEEIAVTKARIDTASSRVAQARAAVEQVKTSIEYAVVRAPVSGVVTRKNVEPGQVVQPGQALLAVVPLEDVWVTANFKETQLKDIRIGQEAEVHIDAYGGAPFKAHVDSISAATGARFSLLPAENASGNFVKVVQRIPIKLVFDPGNDSSRVLRPGMSAVVKVITGPKTK